PAKLKMTKPRYQDIPADTIPETKKSDGTRIRVITGTVDGTSGPVKGIAANPIYLDISVPPKTTFVQPVERGHTAFSYLFEGEAIFGDGEEVITHPRLVVWNDGDSIRVVT